MVVLTLKLRLQSIIYPLPSSAQRATEARRRLGAPKAIARMPWLLALHANLRATLGTPYLGRPHVRLLEVPLPPLLALHALAVPPVHAAQVAGVKVPPVDAHEAVPDTVYPGLHVGWHVEPAAMAFVQSPLVPQVGAALPSHVVPMMAEGKLSIAVAA